MLQHIYFIVKSIVGAISVYSAGFIIIQAIKGGFDAAHKAMEMPVLTLSPFAIGGLLISLSTLLFYGSNQFKKQMLKLTSGRRTTHNMLDFIRLTVAAVILWLGIKYAVLAHNVSEWWFPLCFTLFCLLSFWFESAESDLPWEQRNPGYIGKLSGAFLIGIIEIII